MIAFPIKALFIEDALDYAAVLAASIRPFRSRLTVEHHTTLQLGLEALNGQDVILTDLNLPDSAGVDTVRRIRERTNKPLIVLSGVEDLEIVSEVIVAGADEFIPKSSLLNFPMLAAIVTVVCKHQIDLRRHRHKQETCDRVRKKWEGLGLLKVRG